MQDRRNAVKETPRGAGKSIEGADESAEGALGKHRGITRRTQTQQERVRRFVAHSLCEVLSKKTG